MTCLCGDYSCPRCFPQPRREPSSDDLYERHRQRELDEAVAAGDPARTIRIMHDMTRDSVEQFRRDQVQKFEALLRRQYK